MLESFLLERELKNKKISIFLLGIIFAIIGIYIANIIFPLQRGLISVFLVTIPAIYPMTSYLKREAKIEEKLKSELSILKRHERELGVYLAFFLGVTVGFTVATFFLPADFFSIQMETIGSLAKGALIFDSIFFSRILLNNLMVFSICFIFSFIFAAGAVFILIWNASVLGFFFAKTSKIIYGLPMVALSYLPHGLLEISAYCLAGISGSMLSYHIEKMFLHGYEDKVFLKQVADYFLLLVIGFGLLILGALVEAL